MSTTSTQNTPDLELLRLLFGKNVTMALAVAAKLRIADHLADGPKSAADLAGRTHAHGPSLYRVLRLLASLDVLAEEDDGRFALAPMGEHLRTGVPGSLRGVAEHFGSEWSWQAWSRMFEGVRTGRPSFEIAFGETVFEYFGERPQATAVFQEAMAGFTSGLGPGVVEAYDFSPFRTIVDVGGGHGSLLFAILAAYPEAQGVVFDSPHVVGGAEKAIHEAGLSARCRAVGGDFFRATPAGGDLYLLKHVVHDWSDDESTRILSNCRAAVNPGGRLLLIETVVSPEIPMSYDKFLDMEMLVMITGRERTEEEFRRLLAGAGWRSTRVIPAGPVTRILEAEPAE